MGTDTQFIPHAVDIRKAETALETASYLLAEILFKRDWANSRLELTLESIQYYQSEASKYLNGTYRYNPPAVI